MAKRTRPEIEVVFDDGSSCIAASGRVFAQVREGRLTLEALDRVLELWQTRFAAIEEPVVALVVLGQDAEMPPEPVRARQMAVIAEVGGRPKLRTALVVEGSGIYVQLRRVLLRSMTHGETIFYTPEEAAAAVAPGTGISEEHILAVVAAARRP